MADLNLLLSSIRPQNKMATIADISQALGDYMLKGWVLTDQSCPTPGCTVPLLRSPKGRTPITTICAKCQDKIPTSQAGNPLSPSTGSEVSRSSTPPTEISEVPESPVFVPLEESEETRRRRAQSDQASSEIGKRLLKGWAMLGDECPNDSCYGVPLIRPPKSGGEKDPRKECVICGNVYVSEVDWAGRETLVAEDAKSNNMANNSGVIQSSASQPHLPATTSNTERHPFSSPFGRHLETPESHSDDKPGKLKLKAPLLSPRLPSIVDDATQIPLMDTIGVYRETSEALQRSLRALSARLGSISPHSVLDISSTADAISKVAQALLQVKELERTNAQ